MAKIMARIDGGVVANIEWCGDRVEQTETLINIGDRSVGIGDTYTNGHFYHHGKVVLTIAEQLAAANQTLADLAEYAAEVEYQNALNELGLEV